jgi:hypothetical protein
MAATHRTETQAKEPFRHKTQGKTPEVHSHLTNRPWSVRPIGSTRRYLLGEPRQSRPKTSMSPPKLRAYQAPTSQAKSLDMSRADIRRKVRAVRAAAVAAGNWPGSRNGPLPQPIAATLQTDPPNSVQLHWVTWRRRRFLTPAEGALRELQKVSKCIPPPREVW